MIDDSKRVKGKWENDDVWPREKVENELDKRTYNSFSV